jgi:hypothetical protein
MTVSYALLYAINDTSGALETTRSKTLRHDPWLVRERDDDVIGYPAGESEEFRRLSRYRLRHSIVNLSSD